MPQNITEDQAIKIAILFQSVNVQPKSINEPDKCGSKFMVDGTYEVIYRDKKVIYFKLAHFVKQSCCDHEKERKGCTTSGKKKTYVVINNFTVSGEPYEKTIYDCKC